MQCSHWHTVRSQAWRLFALLYLTPRLMAVLFKFLMTILRPSWERSGHYNFLKINLFTYDFLFLNGDYADVWQYKTFVWNRFKSSQQFPNFLSFPHVALQVIWCMRRECCTRTSKNWITCKMFQNYYYYFSFMSTPSTPLLYRFVV